MNKYHDYHNYCPLNCSIESIMNCQLNGKDINSSIFYKYFCFIFMCRYCELLYRFGQDLPLWQSSLSRRSDQVTRYSPPSSLLPVGDPLTDTIRPHLFNPQPSSFKRLHREGINYRAYKLSLLISTNCIMATLKNVSFLSDVFTSPYIHSMAGFEVHVLIYYSKLSSYFDPPTCLGIINVCNL